VVPEARAAAAPAETPEGLYDEGRKAYRLGDYETAVQKWERAYALSDNALLLYNISLAYKGRYGITKDLADLRRARAVIDNFVTIAKSNDDVDVDDAED
jgi:tetratricopeptide (TPR) repeat protein